MGFDRAPGATSSLLVGAPTLSKFTTRAEPKAMIRPLASLVRWPSRPGVVIRPLLAVLLMYDVLRAIKASPAAREALTPSRGIKQLWSLCNKLEDSFPR